MSRPSAACSRRFAATSRRRGSRAFSHGIALSRTGNPTRPAVHMNSASDHHAGGRRRRGTQSRFQDEDPPRFPPGCARCAAQTEFTTLASGPRIFLDSPRNRARGVAAFLRPVRRSFDAMSPSPATSARRSWNLPSAGRNAEQPGSPTPTAKPCSNFAALVESTCSTTAAHCGPRRRQYRAI